MVRKVKLLYVVWVDAMGGTSEWTAIETLKKQVTMEVFSTGFLFDETDEYILLVPHWHPNTEMSKTGETGVNGFGEIAIPKCSIKERKVIKTIEVDDGEF